MLLPLVVTAIAFWNDLARAGFATDFHNEYWPAAERTLAGGSPYLLGRGAAAAGTAFPYPAAAALLFAPLTILPRGVADGLVTLALIGSPLLALHILKVSDRRLYGLVLLWPPVLNGWSSANLSLLNELEPQAEGGDSLKVCGRTRRGVRSPAIARRPSSAAGASVNPSRARDEFA